MKKSAIVALIIFGMSITQGRSQGEGLLIPYLSTMVTALNTVNGVMRESEESLKGIQKTLGTVRRAKEFFKYAVAVRAAINLMVCLADNMTDVDFKRLLVLAGVSDTNLFSDFLTCQYDIYFTTINLDVEYIQSNIRRAFDRKEDLNITQRLEMINRVINSIETIRYRTVQAKGILLEVMQKHIDAALAEEVIILFYRI